MSEKKKRLGIKNVGPKTEQWLKDVGVQSYADLERLGSVEVYRRLKERDPAVSLNALYALEAALWDLHWLELPPELKEKVKREAAQG
jgi:DNA transformation protein and related proteins